MPRHLAVLAILVALTPAARALAEESSEMELFELNDLLKKDVAVASQKAATLREAPGVVTVITRDQIINSGAVDLTDLLAQVPGVWFGVDVEGVVDVGFRGLWAHEGKTLLRVDGLEMNDLLYSNNTLINHIPLSDVERIEINRGPGSVQYGGSAELVVIDVITRSAQELYGVGFATTVAPMQRAMGEANASVAAGLPAAQLHGVDFKVSAEIGAGGISDRTLTDFYGTSYSLAEGNTNETAFVNMSAKWKGLQVRFIYDGYGSEERDGYGQVLSAPQAINFPGIYADAKYDLTLGKLTLTPQLSLTRQTPWESPDPSQPTYFSTSVQRLRGRLTASYAFTDHLSLVGGLDAYHDHAWVNVVTDNVGANLQFGSNLANDVTYANVAAFAELQWETFAGNITAGARVENHSQFGSSFVPRLAYTKVFDRFHVKALASGAFRAPAIENIANEDTTSSGTPPGNLVTPEHTTAFELEAGYRFTENVFATVNAFDMTIHDPIIYYNDSVTQTDYYRNFGQTGSLGAEADVKLEYRWGSAEASYSFYSSAGKNTVDLYDVPGKSGVLLAFPAHKVAASASLKIWQGLRLNPSAIFLSERYGYLTGDGQGGSTANSTGSTFLANVYVNYTNLFVDGLTAGIGVMNLFDTEYAYIQPYNSGHPPLPARSRELVMHFTWDFATL